MKKTIYLAGPVTGMPGHNKKAFTEAQQQLERMGHRVVNPHLLIANASVDPDDWALCMKICIRRLCSWFRSSDNPIDLVVLLPGWQESKGATLEYTLAGQLGIPTVLYEDVRNKPELLEVAAQ